ncbi:hypothetical protein [Streptosporangium sp. NPDC023615]|uniref:hypothetical protein n=1 Tax=Streptosporangium sp. NPDC023615 TaxID=3154794 RepID=UPI003441B1B6
MRLGGLAYVLDRASGGVTYLPDAIGEVTGWGNVEDGAPWDDPPGTVRVQYARPSGTLFLARHMTRLAARVRENYPDVAVVTTSQHPRDWLAEIASQSPRALFH